MRLGIKEAIALACAAIALAACDPVDSKFTTICEEMIKERLIAPSGYRRIKVVEWSDAADVLSVGIQYDAPNGFGALIRGGGICEYDSADGSDIDAWKVRLSGKTRLEWVRDLLGKQ